MKDRGFAFPFRNGTRIALDAGTLKLLQCFWIIYRVKRKVCSYRFSFFLFALYSTRYEGKRNCNYFPRNYKSQFNSLIFFKDFLGRVLTATLWFWMSILRNFTQFCVRFYWHSIYHSCSISVSLILLKNFLGRVRANSDFMVFWMSTLRNFTQFCVKFYWYWIYHSCSIGVSLIFFKNFLGRVLTATLWFWMSILRNFTQFCVKFYWYWIYHSCSIGVSLIFFKNFLGRVLTATLWFWMSILRNFTQFCVKFYWYWIYHSCSISVSLILLKNFLGRVRANSDFMILDVYFT